MPARVETGTAYELLALGLALPADAGDAEPIALPRLGPTARSAFSDVAALGREPLINLMGFAAAGTESSTAAALIAALRQLDEPELLRVLAGYYRRSVRRATDPVVIAAALDGDRGARRALLETSFPEVDHWRTSLGLLTGRRRLALSSRLVAGLDRLHGELTEWLQSSVERADPAAARARDLITRMPVDLAIEQLAAGGEIVFARAIGQADVVIAPRGSDPRIYVVVDYGTTLLVSYPAAPAEATTPPGRLIAVGQALGDERRLQLLKALANGPLTIAELVARVGLPRTTLQYHLSVLRESGLVGWAVDDAQGGPLAIRRSAIAGIEAGLRDYLGLPATERDAN